MKNPKIIALLILSLCISQFLFSQHLTNNGSDIIILQGTTLNVTGDFYIVSDVIIDNSGDIFVGGNWINNSPDDIYMEENTGAVTLNGSLSQSIGGERSTHFSNLHLEQHTSLGSETSVSTLLGLNNALLALNNNHFIIRNGAEIIGAGEDAYVVAEGEGILVQKVGAFDVEFPVGTSTSFLPATLNNSGEFDNYGINVFEDVLDDGLTGSTIPEIDHCVNNTWNILEELIGGSDLSVTLQWNAADEGLAFNRTQSGIGHFTIGAWDAQDGTPAVGDDPYSLTRSGISSIGAFSVGDNNSPMVITIVYDDQDIFLTEGWAGISSYLIPVDPAVGEVLNPVINELIILQNQMGMYWPGQGINTLENWESHSGYQVKMSGEIQLTITGTIEANTTLNLSEGWNLIPVISSCAVEIEELFAGTGMVMVREVAGTAVNWPDFGISTLGKLTPGSAYMVSMDTAEDIVFPDCFKNNKENELSGSPRVSLNQASEITGNTELIPTPNIHTIAIPVSAFNGVGISIGDVLEAYDENNNCFGMALWDGEAMSISLFGNDQTTAELDGFVDWNPIYFKIFETSSGDEKLLEATFDDKLPENNGLFVSNGISSITEFKLSPTGIGASVQSGIQLFPNPATDQFTVRNPSGDEVELKIYNIHGLEVLSLTLSNFTTDINISAFPAGPYLVKINGWKSSYVQRLIIQ